MCTVSIVKEICTGILVIEWRGSFLGGRSILTVEIDCIILICFGAKNVRICVVTIRFNYVHGIADLRA